jgi:hypothetical protein
VAGYGQYLRLPRIDLLLWIITSSFFDELVKEFYARLSVESAVAEALLIGLLHEPTFQGDDDGRKQD